MKRLSTWFALILILSASLLNVENLASAESKQQRGVQHKAQTQPAQNKAKNQQPQVIFIPSSVLDSVVAALRESDDAVEQQAIAAQKQAEANQQSYFSPAVVVNGVLAAIGFCYLIFMGLQWKAIEHQNDAFKRSQRAQVILGRTDGKLMELIQPKVGERLTVKMFFLNSGSVAAEQFFVHTMVGVLPDVPTQMPRGKSLEPQPWRRQGRRGGIARWSAVPIAAKAIHIEFAFSLNELTQEDMYNFEGGRHVSVTGKYQYFDGFGQPEYRTFNAHYSPELGDFVDAAEVWGQGGYSLDPKNPGFGMNSVAPEQTDDTEQHE